ncbi:MAG: membrane protein insertion efficiency factor YidD [Nitrospirota bacterium]|nr:MAG: membrane protein insertion efficiency factor YidD [Nitrospirota bacterium]
MVRIFLRAITIYQSWISPFFGPHCRFDLSCSQYAYQAIERYGMFQGIKLTIMRLLRCHPFHPGGADPVP